MKKKKWSQCRSSYTVSCSDMKNRTGETSIRIYRHATRSPRFDIPVCPASQIDTASQRRDAMHSMPSWYGAGRNSFDVPGYPGRIPTSEKRLGDRRDVFLCLGNSGTYLACIFHSLNFLRNFMRVWARRSSFNVQKTDVARKLSCPITERMCPQLFSSGEERERYARAIGHSGGNRNDCQLIVVSINLEERSRRLYASS